MFLTIADLVWKKKKEKKKKSLQITLHVFDVTVVGESLFKQCAVILL